MGATLSTAPQPPRPRGLPLSHGYMQSPPPAMARTGQRKACMVCFEDLVDDAAGNDLPHKCQRCHDGIVCAGCLREWFLDACRNESKMPPKCCSIIPLSTASRLLKSHEVELYKSKYQEWSTPDRLYCPKPSCSTFIPLRLLVDKTNSGKMKELSCREDSGVVAPSVLPSPFPLQSPTTELPEIPSFVPKQQKQKKANVTCPSCETSICTKCRSLTHLGLCPESDIDPELEAQLKKWDIKRCPNCRAAVRRMFGCSRLECRCGANFCSECLLPMNACGGCQEVDHELDYVWPEDDLDGNTLFLGHELGEEPEETTSDTWACHHSWMPVVRFNDPLLRNENWECHYCLRTVKPAYAKTGPLVKDEDMITGVTAEPGWPSNIYGQPAWKCMAGHLQCNRCPKNPPRDLLGDESWLWTCDCGVQCIDCNQSQVRVQEEKAETAWECGCGIVICGECKELVTLLI